MLAAAGFACGVNELGKIPCHDTSNCPSNYPTCSAAGFCVNSAGAFRIEVISGDAQAAVVGNALAQPLVTRVLDTNGNAVAGFGVTWAVGSGAGQVSAGSTTTGPDGKASITATVGTTAGGNTFTVSAAGVTGTTFTATGIAASAVTLAVTGFSNTVTAGTAGSVTVTARDAFGNTATGYLGTVRITSSDGAATLAANHTYTAGEAGVHTFSVTLKTAAPSASITAADAVTTTITGSQTGILVNPGATTKLLVTGYPSPARADTGGSVTVTAQDANNNTTPAYRGAVKFTSDNPNPSLPADYLFVAGDNGVHTFTGVVLKKASPPSYSITATDTMTASITGSQTGIVVNAGATTKLLVTGFPSPVFGGTPASVTVTAQDANGNTTPAYTGMIAFTTDNPNAVLPAPYTFTGIGGDNGVHTFGGVILKKASPPNYSITATDTGTASITGSQTGIVVNAGATKLLVTGFPNPVFGGTPSSVSVTAQNADNSTATAYRGTVQFVSSDITATLPPAYDFMAGDAGVHTFAGVILNATTGAASITVTDAANGTITGSQTGIVVNAGPLVFGATATLINGGTRNGLIFIAGGSASTNGASPFSTTWFYNPASSSLTAGPALAFARSLHTATAIGGGQVLVAGGSPGAPAGFTEFELCSLDGATPSCAATGGALATPRCNAAAALVSATQVLIAGGDNCANVSGLFSWDLWDGTAPSSPVGNATGLTTRRRLLTATVVAPGKVLLAGGAPTATADVFTLNATTPASSTVAATAGPMTSTRVAHTATLLTSTTATTACPSAATASCVLLAGGNSAAGKAWEIYDASMNNFPLSAATAGTLRQFHAAAAFANGKVLIAGGSNGANAVNTTEVFDPAATTLGFTSGLGLQLTRFRTAAAYASAQDVLVLIGGNAFGPSTEQVITP